MVEYGRTQAAGPIEQLGYIWLFVISGIFLVVIGLFILLGRLQRLNIFLFKLSNNLDLWQQTSPVQVQIMFGVLFLIPAILLGIFYIRRLLARKERRFLPVRSLFLVLFIALSILSFTGTINSARFFTFWFTFQGI